MVPFLIMFIKNLARRTSVNLLYQDLQKLLVGHCIILLHCQKHHTGGLQ